jgi:hypothetical protein
LTIVVVEHCTHPGKAVNVGRFDEFVSIAAHDGLQVINSNEKNVGFLGLLGQQVH